MKKLLTLILLLSLIASAQNSHYPPQTGGGGTVTDINGATGPSVDILAGTGISVTTVGNNITIGNTGSDPVGTPNTFAGFDGTGALETIPGFNINGSNGLNEELTQSPNNLGFQTQNDFSVNFTPLQDSPNEGWNIQNIQAFLDSGSSGFSQGTNGTAVQLLNLDMTHHGTGNTGALNNLVMNADLGNGTDPITIQGLAYSYGFGNIHANVTMDGAINGYSFQPNVDAAAIGTSNFNVNVFSDFANIGIPVNGYTFLNANPNLFAVTNNHNYTGVNLNPNITTFQGNAGFNGFGVSGNVTTMSATGQYAGMQINPNIATSHGNIMGIGITPQVTGGDASFTGINIAPNGAVTFSNAQALNIQLNNIKDTNPQGVVGINSDSRMSVDAETTLQPGQGFQIGNRIESLLHVPPGSPVTGTDSLGNDFAGDLEAEDNIALGPIGLGWASVGFIADMAVAAAKTVAAVDVFVPAVALPDPGFPTGGAVTDMTMVRTFAPLSQGGTIAITNLYGFKIDSSIGGPFSAAATNAWGLYIQDPNLNNFIEGNVGIGNTTPTSRLDLPAVTTSAGSSSLKIAAGTLMTTPENGAIESDGVNLWWTDNTGTRNQLGASNAANTSLSNLTSTSINHNLVGDGIGTHNLGSVSIGWGSAYINVLRNTIDNTTIDMNAAQASDSTGNVSLDWTNRNLVEPAGTNVLNWSNPGLVIGAPSTTATHTLNTATATPGAGIGTITNLPTGFSGNPTGYISMTINGAPHVIPFW